MTRSRLAAGLLGALLALPAGPAAQTMTTPRTPCGTRHRGFIWQSN